MVGDKGYHGNDILVELVEQEYRSYISEPERGGRKWKDKQAEQAATYANRRRIRGTRGKRLIRRRGELLERPFAHYLEAGGMQRTHLRRHENILKRLLTHVAGFNLGILMRNLIGKATPKEYAELKASLIAALLRFVSTNRDFFTRASMSNRVSIAKGESLSGSPSMSSRMKVIPSASSISKTVAVGMLKRRRRAGLLNAAPPLFGTSAGGKTSMTIQLDVEGTVDSPCLLG